MANIYEKKLEQSSIKEIFSEADDREIEKKIMALESELDGMRSRTTGFLKAANQSEYEIAYQPPAPKSFSNENFYQTQINNSYQSFNSNQQSDTFRVEISKQGEHISEMTEQLDVERQTLLEERRRRQSLEVESSDLRARCSDLERQAFEIRSRFSSEISELTNQLKIATENYNLIKNQYANVEAHTTYELNMGRQALTERELSEKARDHAESKMREMERELNEVRAQYKIQTDRLSSIMEHQEESDHILRQTRSMADQASQIEVMRQEAEQTVIMLRTQIVELQRLRKQDSIQIQSFISEIETLRKELSSTREELIISRSEADKANTSLISSNAEVTQLRIVIDRQRQECRYLADTVSQLQSEVLSLRKRQHECLISSSAICSQAIQNGGNTIIRDVIETAVPSPIVGGAERSSHMSLENSKFSSLNSKMGGLLVTTQDRYLNSTDNHVHLYKKSNNSSAYNATSTSFNSNVNNNLTSTTYTSSDYKLQYSPVKSCPEVVHKKGNGQFNCNGKETPNSNAPWACHDGVQAPRCTSDPQHTIPEMENLTLAEEAQMEKQLLKLNQEKANLESWLLRHSNTSCPLGSSLLVSEKRERSEKDKRLEQVQILIGKIKSQMRRKNILVM